MIQKAAESQYREYTKIPTKQTLTNYTGDMKLQGI